VLIEASFAVDILDYANNYTERNMSSQVLSTQASSLAISAWIRLLRSYTSATRDLSSQLQAEHGLTINDYEALLHLSLAEEGAMRRIDLAGELLLTPSGVTRLLDGLERAGHVCKGSCPGDLRVTYAVLTETGRNKLAEASRSHVAAVTDLFRERFSDEELGTLAELLGRLPGAVGESEECTGGHE
jgi:DNA-binding MarR family transcriptional regulator